MKNSVMKMNAYLSDLVVFYLKLHDLHWNVKGKMFVQVHEYTDARYEDMAAKFDEIAELIIMHGGKPVSTIREYLDNASIKEAGRGEYRDEEVLKILIEDLSHLNDEAVALRAEMDEDGVFGAVAVLEDHIAGYRKELWFLRSMMA